MYEEIIKIRRRLKQLAADPATPEALRAELTTIQFGIKAHINSVYPRVQWPTRAFKLVEQEALMAQMEAVTRTAQENLRRALAGLETLDFRTVKSEADYLLPTLAANVDNERLTDEQFRNFVRNSIKES
jgi:DNA polymerase elongation subunit (family B)